MKTPISWHFIGFQTAHHKILFTALRLSSREINPGGQWEKPPEADSFFLNLSYENPHFLAFFWFQTATHKYTSLCFKAFFQRNKQGNGPVGDRGETPFPGNLSCFKQPLTKYYSPCFKAFFRRYKPSSDKGEYPKTLYS